MHISCISFFIVDLSVTFVKISVTISPVLRFFRITVFQNHFSLFNSLLNKHFFAIVCLLCLKFRTCEAKVMVLLLSCRISIALVSKSMSCSRLLYYTAYVDASSILHNSDSDENLVISLSLALL